MEENIEAAHHETNIEEKTTKPILKKNYETNIENHNKLPRSFNGGKKARPVFCRDEAEKYWGLLGNA